MNKPIESIVSPEIIEENKKKIFKYIKSFNALGYALSSKFISVYLYVKNSTEQNFAKTNLILGLSL
jgi:hypothetical protein